MLSMIFNFDDFKHCEDIFAEFATAKVIQIFEHQI